MKLSLLDKLRCVECKKGALCVTHCESSKNDSNVYELLEGTLECNTCDEMYNVTHGVPNMLPK